MPANSSAMRFIRIVQSPWLILLIILATIAAIIWNTLGLKTTALFEDWGLFNVFSQGASPFDTSIVGSPTRFLMSFCTWIGYQLTPNSFVGLNLYNAVLFVLQGMMTFTLIRRLRPDNTLFATSVAILFTIFPAETSLGNNRYVGYHTCVLCFLASIYCLIHYWQHRHIIALAGIIIFSVLNLGIIEISYPVVILTPFLLVWWDPARRVSWHVIRVTAIWYLVPGLLLFENFAVIAAGHEVYQSKLFATDSHLSLAAHVTNYGAALIHAYFRVLVQGWTEAIGLIDMQGGRFSVVVFITILIAAGLMLISRYGQPTYERPSMRHSASDISDPQRTGEPVIESDRAWLILGLLIIGLGFAIYALLPTHQVFTERVYLISSLGGAIVATVTLGWIGDFIHRKRLFLPLSVAFLMGIALQSGLVNVLRTRTASDQEQVLFSQIVTQAPGLDKARLVLILDPTHQLATSLIVNIITPHGVLINIALYYLYQHYNFDVRVCDPNMPTQPISDLSCILGTHDVRFKNEADSTDAVFPLDSVIAFDYEGEGKLTLVTTWPTAGAAGYDPTLISSQIPLPDHFLTLFNRWPFQMQTSLNEHPSQSVSFNQNSLLMFMDAPTLPLIAYGWIGNWTASTRSTLDVWLSADRDYQLKTVISHSTLPETLKHITLTVNDQPIPLTAQTDPNGVLTLTGTIPRDIVARDLTKTRITFLSSPITSPLAAGTGDDPHDLGFQVDQFSVTALPVAAS